MTFEVTQEMRRTASVSADSASDALTIAKQKFDKQFGYMGNITYTVRLLMPMPDMAAEMPKEVRKIDR